jgi:hypothetical protein
MMGRGSPVDFVVMAESGGHQIALNTCTSAEGGRQESFCSQESTFSH